MLQCVKRSDAYRRLYRRFAGAKPFQPSESWTEGELLYIVFDLLPATAGQAFTPLALFVIHCRLHRLLLARHIAPNPDGTTVEIVDLYHNIEGATDDRTS